MAKDDPRVPGQEAEPVEAANGGGAEGEPAGAEPPAPPSDPGASADEMRDRWLRTEAELQTFRRRARRDAEEARRAAEEAAMLEVVSFIDDLERALEAAAGAEAPAAWTEGVQLVAGRMRDYLSRNGVEAMDPVGTPFDPRFHEAVLEVDVPEGASPGSVVNVVRKGYRRQGRALRAARVVVARGGDHGSA